ncbi:SurA N-terminal domain-containing protein [Sphingomonas sp. 2R-10]|uniref:peptidylprolyl isomerase n=1 Tax=Sphingomonas sp. 2R-10 TaxID=3045148 RepID=UPI000F782B23|nr:peptidylprolyl isomerase [Sphingomonas sp. 2R-10]MDJ0277269.1 SurA N-terminal domain-containing protein [Sphingomonas sp. 2R-10]
MLGFFRRMTKSKVGIFVGLLLLAVIAIGFAVADLNGLRPASMGGSGAAIATVGDDKITDTALTERIRGDVQQAAQRQPGLDTAQYIARGGFEGSLNRAISDAALRQFAQEHGLVVSDRYVDGQIASLPAFQGLDGKFHQQTFEQTLSRARITPQQLRDDIRRATLTRLMLERTIESSFLPQQLALPYASLAKEARTGQVAIVPTGAFPAPAAPTDQQLQAYYTANRARYTVPERRVIRYAIVTPASVTAQAAPSDAEVQAAYRANAARFAPSQTRSVTQVVVADQAAATKLAQAVRGGQAPGAAAGAIGLEATTLAGQTRGQLAGRTSPAVADAAFAAQQGAVVGPVRSPLGFVVLKVDAVTQVPGKTLEQARPELVAELSKTKGATALGAIQEKIDGGITDGATFDEIVADARLSAQATPPVTAQGIDPMRPAQPDPRLAPIIEAGFASEAGDAPQIVQTAADGTFALVATGDVTRAAPRPLAEIRDQVAGQYRQDQALKAARAVAQQILNKVNGGMPLGTAVAQAGLRLPAPRPVTASRAQLAQLGPQVPPALSLMFSMAPRKARLTAAPNGEGWLLVYLDNIQRGNAANDKAAITGVGRELGRLTGNEYAEQFVEAVRRQVGVQRNEQAINRVRNELVGGAAPAAAQ